MAKISIIVPFYKVPYEYMHQCIKSIRNQVFSDLEIILVDDGSPDDCGKICDEYAAIDPRIKVIHKKNGGLSDARNAGIDAATSEWVTFVDGDDWIEEDFCQHFIERISKQDNLADIYFYSGFRNYPTGKEHIGVPHFHDGRRFSAYEEREYLQSKCCTIHLEKGGNRKGITISSAWAKVYNTQYLKNNNLYFPIVPYDEDSIFYMYVLEVADSVEYVSKAVYHYRYTENSIVNKYRPNAIAEQEIYLGSLFEFVDKYNKTEEFRTNIYWRAMTSMLLLLKQFFYNDKNLDTGINKWKASKTCFKKEPFCRVFATIDFNRLGRNAKIKYVLLYLRCYGLVEYLRRKNTEKMQK